MELVFLEAGVALFLLMACWILLDVSWAFPHLKPATTSTTHQDPEARALLQEEQHVRQQELAEVVGVLGVLGLDLGCWLMKMINGFVVSIGCNDRH